MGASIRIGGLLLWCVWATVLNGSSGAPQPASLYESNASTSTVPSSSNVSKHNSLLAWFNLFGDYTDKMDLTSPTASTSSPVASVGGAKSAPGDLSSSAVHGGSARSPQSLLADPQTPDQNAPVVYDQSEGVQGSSDNQQPVTDPAPTSSPDTTMPPPVEGSSPTEESSSPVPLTDGPMPGDPEAPIPVVNEGYPRSPQSLYGNSPVLPPPGQAAPPPMPVPLPDPIDWSLLPLAMEYPGGLCLTSSDRRIGTCLPVNMPCGMNYEKESPEMCSLSRGTKCCVKADEASNGLPIAEVFPGGKCKVSDGRVGDCRPRDLGCPQGSMTQAEAVCIKDLYNCCLSPAGQPQLEVVARSWPSGCTITDGRSGVCIPVHFGCPDGTESPPSAACSIVMGLKCCVPPLAAVQLLHEGAATNSSTSGSSAGTDYNQN